MAADPRVQQLLDELIDPEASPEDVCRSCPDLLPEVRARWRQMCRTRAELDAMFPPGPAPEMCTVSRQENGVLPRITGYEVEAVLGQGGVGIVFRARNLRLGRPVALKMLLAGAYAGPMELARFQREAEAVASLCHANIVQIYEVGDHERRPFFTMELVDGGSLAQKIRANLPPVRWAAEVVASLAEAMAVAHGAGIVHRDLKPANILLTADGTPKISDFGLARRLEGQEGLTWTGTAVGTPSYMAPEQASGTTGRVGPAADVYGLGAVLYELLTGRPPFRGGTALETFRQVLTDQPIPPSRLNPQAPRDLETVCLKCLQKEPQQRYSGAAALAQDLRRYLFGQVVTARPVGHTERVGKWIRRNKVVASLSAVAAIALVAGTVASLVFAFEAGRQADIATGQTSRLEEQANELKNQKEVETRILVSGWLGPTGVNKFQHSLDASGGELSQLVSMLAAFRPTSTVDAAEAEVMRQIRAAPGPARMQFLEMALRDSDAAQRVGRRADWVAHAIVGCDPALRAELEQRLVRWIQEPGAPPEVVLACTQLGLSVNLKDRAWAERSAPAVIIALRALAAKGDGHYHLAETLAMVNEHLSQTQAAGHAAEALDVLLTVLREVHEYSIKFDQLGRAIVVISPWLDADAATRAAEAIHERLHKAKAYPFAWEPLAAALVAVSRRLPQPAAATQVNRTFDWILQNRDATSGRQKSYYYFHAKALRPLCEKLDAGQASRAADAILASLGDCEMTGNLKTEFISNPVFAEVLTALVERLDESSNLRAAEELIRALRKSERPIYLTEPLRIALVSCCRRLDAAGAARVSDAVIAAVRDPKTSHEVRTILSHVLAAVSGQLSPTQTGSLESALVDSLLPSLADAKSLSSSFSFGDQLGRALASVCGRPGAKSAARAAAALTETIRNPQTPVYLLKPLAAALVAVCGQLPPMEASSHVNRTVAVLDALWASKMKPWDLQFLTEAQAAVWTCLTPTESAARARRAAATLVDLFRDPKATPDELGYLVRALFAVCRHLGPTERYAHTNTAVDTFLAALGKHKNEWPIILRGWGTLADQCAHLDRPGVDRVTDALLAALDDREMRRSLLELSEKMFKNVTVCMDEASLQRLLEHPLAVGPLRRVVLDVLGGAKNRSFRGMWDYLDWIEANANGVPPPRSPR